MGEREGLDIIDSNLSAWVNQYAANCYGLEQLTAQPAETSASQPWYASAEVHT